MTSEFPVREQVARDIRDLKRDCAEPGHPGLASLECTFCAWNNAIEAAAKAAEKVPHKDSWVTPDWIMVGVPRSGVTANLPGPYAAQAGVMVLASTQLSGAEFIRELVAMEPVQVPGARRLARIPQYRSTLLAEITAFQTAYAADYPSALRDMLSRAGWGKPSDGDSLAIEPPG